MPACDAVSTDIRLVCNTVDAGLDPQYCRQRNIGPPTKGHGQIGKNAVRTARRFSVIDNHQVIDVSPKGSGSTAPGTVAIGTGQIFPFQALILPRRK